ncbi:MAG: hypothetical protein KIS96_10935 [Bauldia sp.]|nr:hypothetical protein [Bauldia sp.]
MARASRRVRPLVAAVAFSAAFTTAAAADSFVRCVPDYILEVVYDPESGSWTRSHPEPSVAYRLYDLDDWSIHVEENGVVTRLRACEGTQLFGQFSCAGFGFDFAHEPMMFVRIVGEDFEDGAPATTARIETGPCFPASD